MQSVSNLSLAVLRPGHEFPGANINARKHDRAADVDQMAASIGEEGILQSLLVVQAPDKKHYYVADGNRRLAALRQLAKAKKIAGDVLVPAILSSETDPVKALRKSLAAGTQHVALHPVDQFETFVECLDKGDTAEKIAARYVLPLKTVKQRLALGQLSPVIREAWRKGKLSAEAAAAYAVTPHHAAQEKHFKRGGHEATSTYSIRKGLIGEEHEVAGYLKFVGKDVYAKGGGKLIEDLFGAKEGAKIADFGLLQKLANDKLKAHAETFLAKGWGWAAAEDDLPREARYSWARKERPTAEEKKKLGVIVGLDYSGSLYTRTGVVKPGTKGIATEDGGKKAKKKAPDALSNSLKERLEITAWLALKTALGNQAYPKGIAVTLAGMVAHQIKPQGYPRTPDNIVSGFKALRDGLDLKVMEAALLKHFDAKDYFPKAPKPVVVKAIAEIAGDVYAKKYAAGTKAEAWKFALTRARENGWLPPELRFDGYTGAGAKKKGR